MLSYGWKKGYWYSYTAGIWSYAGIIAQHLLEKRFEKEEYTQGDKIPGFWSHKWHPVSFTLIVGDFGLKYVGEEHANYRLFGVKK